MKLKGTVKMEIYVSGKLGKECGTRENYCRFQYGTYFDKERCAIFNKKLE